MTNDASELRTFSAELGRIGPKVESEVKRVVEKGALNVKNTMRDDMRASFSFNALANTIDYDISDIPGGVEAEIGPSKRSGGSKRGLNFGANIAYFGGSRGGGGTVDVENGLRKEAPNLAANLRRVMGDVF